MFEWTDQCSKAFNHLRELLMEYPILRYPNPKQGYILYTDASGIRWSGVLTQEHLDKKAKQKKPPHLLRKWTVQRKPAELGSIDQGGICNLYVGAEVKLLRNSRGSDHQERPSASEKVLK